MGMASSLALEQSTVLERQVQGAGQELVEEGRSRRREVARATPSPLYTILALIAGVFSAMVGKL